jgi:hypothetical protein
MISSVACMLAMHAPRRGSTAALLSIIHGCWPSWSATRILLILACRAMHCGHGLHHFGQQPPAAWLLQLPSPR